MKIAFKDIRTKSPFNMRQTNPDIESLLVEFQLKSESLKFSLAGELRPRSLHQTDKLLYCTVILVAFVIFVVSFSTVQFIPEDLIPNFGPEVPALVSLYNFHLFVAYLQLTRVNTYYTFFSFAMAFISICQSFTMMSIGIYFLARDDMYRRNQQANNRELLAERDRYVGYVIIGYLLSLIALVIYSPTLIFKSYYNIFLYLVFSFPLLQVFITYKRFINKKVFSYPFQMVLWWIPLFPLMLWKAVPNDLVNMSPDRPLVIFALSTVVFSALFMFLQSKFGLYFYLPTDWIPGYINMKRKVDKIPKEKLEEICSICYSALKYEIGAADGELELVEAGLEESAMLPLAEEIFVTPCDHYFHVNCLMQWLTTKKQTCPLCNRAVHFIE